MLVTAADNLCHKHENMKNKKKFDKMADTTDTYSN